MENIKINGMINLRDLGGNKTFDGRTVKSRRILRSDPLNKVDGEGLAILRDKYRLSKVIDLRTDTECGERPDNLPEGAAYLHLPIFSEATAGITRERKTELTMDKAPVMTELYRYMVTDDGALSRISVIISEIMDNDGGASLFHCTAGKDRTGVIAMLILGILGASEDTIMEDYLYTNITALPLSEQYRDLVLRETGDKEYAEAIRMAFLADESYISQALQVVHANGGYESFFVEKLGISEARIDAFRDSMLI